MFKFKDRLPHLLMSSVLSVFMQTVFVYLPMLVKQFKVRISQHLGRSQITKNLLTFLEYSKIIYTYIFLLFLYN